MTSTREARAEPWVVQGQSEIGQATLEVLPAWRAFVDGISDAGDTYQYPNLDSHLVMFATGRWPSAS